VGFSYWKGNMMKRRRVGRLGVSFVRVHTRRVTDRPKGRGGGFHYVHDYWAWR